jgi:hypothetical protein
MDLIVAPVPIGYWATFRRSPDGSLTRLKSPNLPPRHTRAEAEWDLLDWLGKRVCQTATAAERAELYPVYKRMLAARVSPSLPPETTAKGSGQ